MQEMQLEIAAGYRIAVAVPMPSVPSAHFTAIVYRGILCFARRWWLAGFADVRVRRT